MLSQIKSKREEGFTIIEVLIVLAIAGLIILIVFLAVPALQRNSRNTALRTDVGKILGAVTEYGNLNNGAFPNRAVASGGTATIDNSSAASDVDATAQVQGGTDVNTTTTAPTTLTAGQIRLRFGYKCNGDVSSRAVAAFYAQETAGTAVVVCQDS